MSVSTIAQLTLRAGLFALIVCALYCGFLRLTGRKMPSGEALLRLFYLCAVTEIIALRGLNMAARHPQVRLVPFSSIAGTWRDGTWSFLYNTLGNLLWFLPVGWFLRRRRWYWALAAGAALSLGLESLQWLLCTGIPDVDDVLVNGLGALFGYSFARIYCKGKGILA